MRVVIKEVLQLFWGLWWRIRDGSRTSTDSSSRGSCIRARRRTPPTRPEVQTSTETVRDPRDPCVSSSRPTCHVSARAFQHFQRQECSSGHHQHGNKGRMGCCSVSEQTDVTQAKNKVSFAMDSQDKSSDGNPHRSKRDTERAVPAQTRMHSCTDVVFDTACLRASKPTCRVAVVRENACHHRNKSNSKRGLVCAQSMSSKS